MTTDRDVWNQMLVNVADYARRLRSEGPSVHRPPRSGPRIGCLMPLTLVSPVSASASAVDFSAAGVRLRVDTPISAQVTYSARFIEHPHEPDLGVEVRPLWIHTSHDGVHEAGCEFVAFDDRPPESVARFFETHPGLTRDVATIPRARHVETGPPVMLTASNGVRKAFLLKLTRTHMAAASQSSYPSGTDIEMAMQVPSGLLRAHGNITACHAMSKAGYHRVEVRFQERLAAEHLHALLPLLEQQAASLLEASRNGNHLPV